MALPLPPAASLHSVLLVTNSGSLGPRLVFHYPPASTSAALTANYIPSWYNQASTNTDDSPSSDNEWDTSTENDGGEDDEVGSKHSGRGSSRARAAGSLHSHRDRERERQREKAAWGRQDTIEDDDEDVDATTGVPKAGSHGRSGGGNDWETVLGFKIEALEKMLCPGKPFNKRRFEMGAESLVFVGAPMFVRDDGKWKKEKKGKKSGRGRDKRTLGEQQIDEETLTGLETNGDRTVKVPPVQKKEEKFVWPEGFEPGYGHGTMSGGASEAVTDAGSDSRSSTNGYGTGPDMTMFNIIFVLNPPALEYHLRVKEMYDNITRKFAKELKGAQAKHEYVWKEAKKILHMKQRAKENGDPVHVAWREIMNSSPLAKSIATIFSAISNDKIAHVLISSTETSFQIPQAISTPYLPTALEPQMPGLWLTTANVINEDEAADGPMTQHSALLLLEDPETIIESLKVNSKEYNSAPEADLKDYKNYINALSFYLRNITPRKSLAKLALKHSIPRADLEYLTGYLVYWRRARLVPPLHPSDTYIVSPNADMSALQSAIPAYAARFPTLPPLPKILSLLSGTPRPYRSFIPTNDHRDAYMDILAWLMRGGWVTQLRTFAWVRVTASIKVAVSLDQEKEEKEKRERLEEALNSSLVLSPRQRPIHSPKRPASDAGSARSDRTSIHLGVMADEASTSRTSLHGPSPLQISKPSSSSLSLSSQAQLSPSLAAHQTQPTPINASAFTPSLVLSPTKANATESRWLEKIGSTFRDKETRDAWPTLLKYFDGRHALDDIAVREGWKRKRVNGLVAGVREGGWLVQGRHW